MGSAGFTALSQREKSQSGNNTRIEMHLSLTGVSTANKIMAKVTAMTATTRH